MIKNYYIWRLLFASCLLFAARFGNKIRENKLNNWTKLQIIKDVAAQHNLKGSQLGWFV